jgi:ribonucleoside-triphosphate reductase
VSEIESYINHSNWRIKQNSNTSFSVSDMEAKIAEKESARWWFSQYSSEIAEAHRVGALYLHNLGRVTTYCMGWDLRALLAKGFGGNPDFLSSAPPHHLRVAFLQMANFLYTVQGEAAGAQAFSNVDTLLAPYIHYECMSDEELEQAIQELVYNLNVPTRASGQPPFLNFQLDIVPPKSLEDQQVMLGDRPYENFTYGDFRQEMDRFNKAFAKVMMAGDGGGKPFSFPIPTYSLPNLKLVDIPEIWEMTAKYGLPYFMMDATNDDSYSMCPLVRTTKLLTRSNGKIVLLDIDQMVHGMEKGATYEVQTPTGWHTATPVATEATDIIEIHLSNGSIIKEGINHLQPTRRGTVTADRLQVGDWIPYNKEGWGGKQLGNEGLGYAIGAFLGNGSYDDERIIFSNRFPDDNGISAVIEVVFNNLGFHVTTKDSEEQHLRSIHIGSGSRQYMERFVTGTATTKSLSQLAWNMSEVARREILVGFHATDGARSPSWRAYTASDELREQLKMLASSVCMKALSTNEDNRQDGRFGKNPVYRVDIPTRASYGDYFTEDDKNYFYRVESVERKSYGDKLYCVSLDTDDHLFYLADGMVTHNCHLRLDKKLLMFHNGGIFAKFPLTGSIGVVTISLPAMSAMKGQGSFFDVLSHYMDLARDSLLIKGDILEGFMDKGLYPYSKYWLQDIKGNTGSYFGNHFRTIGLVGMNEACLMETGKGINTEGGKEWAKRVLEFMARSTDNMTRVSGFLFNLEATPAETAAHYCARGNIKAGMDVKHSGTKETPYYTASSLLPSSFDGGLWAALDNQNELQPLYTGGTVFHIFSEHQFTPKQTEKLIFAIKEKYQLPYITFTPNIRICPEHGWIPDDVQGKCPICGAEITVYSRPVGYLRPVKGFSDAKQEEFRARKFFDDGL